MSIKQIKKNHKEGLTTYVSGHLKVVDDLGKVHVDKQNAIHPQNMARIIARALASENNGYIHRMGFGNGGTDINAAYKITYRPPNDGIADEQQANSTMYNETYSKVVNTIGDLENNVESREVGGKSQIVINVTLSPGEPESQLFDDNFLPSLPQSTEPNNPDRNFMFDEVALFSPGLSGVSTTGYQDIYIGDKTTESATSITPSDGGTSRTDYAFDIQVDGGVLTKLDFAVIPSAEQGIAPTMEEVVAAINSQLLNATAMISGPPDNFMTYGKLRIQSNSTGSTSSVLITKPVEPSRRYLFDDGHLNTVVVVEPQIPGRDAGQDNSTESSSERERLLTHLVFSPILKAANRTLIITYTISIEVARSVDDDDD